MYENQQRIDEFKTELAALRTKSTASVTGDRRFLVLGIALMGVGLIAIMLGWWGASGTTETYEAISYLISGGVMGIGLVIIGVALYLRYSLAGFLKFWLVRWVYEQQAQTDRLLAVMDPDGLTSATKDADALAAADVGLPDTLRPPQVPGESL
jgi:uncharacterized membrane protein YidH (DUF202 family)